MIEEETELAPPAIATSTLSTNAPTKTATTYTQNTVQLTPNTDPRVQAMASSPSDENHQVRESYVPSTQALLYSFGIGFNDSLLVWQAVMGGAGALAAFAAKAMVASNAQVRLSVL